MTIFFNVKDALMFQNLGKKETKTNIGDNLRIHKPLCHVNCLCSKQKIKYIKNKNNHFAK